MIPINFKSNSPQIKEYLEAYKKSTLSYYVLFSNNLWIVKKGLSSNKQEEFTKKKKAINYAKEKAKNEKVNLIIFDELGNIEKRIKN